MVLSTIVYFIYIITTFMASLLGLRDEFTYLVLLMTIELVTRNLK